VPLDKLNSIERARKKVKDNHIAVRCVNVAYKRLLIDKKEKD